MKKSFNRFLKMVKEGIDIYSFTPNSTFKFVVPANVRTGNGEEVSVNSSNTYTVTSTDEENAIVNAKDENGYDCSFDVDSIFDNVEFLTKEAKFAAKAHPEKGKMHQILGIPADKEIKDVYTSGKELAKDLVDKVGKAEAAHMLAFVANVNKEDDIYDVALRAVHNIEENVMITSISEFAQFLKESKNSSGVYKITGTSSKKNASKPLPKIHVEFMNPHKAVKDLTGMSIKAKMGDMGVEIDIDSKEDKDKVKDYLLKNGYGEKDGYGEESIKKLFPILD